MTFSGVRDNSQPIIAEMKSGVEPLLRAIPEPLIALKLISKENFR